ncbi:MAG: M48 family metallopeptidase [bacterium]|nr:M48 family metallopeptidase [bacterium]
MQKEINGISYSIRNTARRRRVVISVRGDGSVVVSKSPRIAIAYVEKFVREKFSWIEAKIREQASRPKKLLAHYSVKDFRENKERARAIVLARLAHFNQFYNYTIGSVLIRNQKSRWGSCSAKGNLNFNYKIVFLPEPLADYLIVHELCHLAEMNHSKRFWALVSQKIPEHKTLRRQMKLF